MFNKELAKSHLLGLEVGSDDADPSTWVTDIATTWIVNRPRVQFIFRRQIHGGEDVMGFSVLGTNKDSVEGVFRRVTEALGEPHWSQRIPGTKMILARWRFSEVQNSLTDEG